MTFVSARTFLSLLGQLNAAADHVVLGRLHLRPLQTYLLSLWRPLIHPLDQLIPVTPDVLYHLSWWKQERIYHQGVPLKVAPVSHTIFTDASTAGWGSHVEPEGLLYHDVWTRDQSRLHINMLEMLAIALTLEAACHAIMGSTVLVSTDNTTVVAYLSHQGGTHSPDLSKETWKILTWCQRNKIHLLVKHIPGRFNTLAYQLSRVNKPISTEWALNQEIANLLFSMTEFPNIDLFATRLNHKLPLYVSPIPDQRALSIDALSMNWNNLHAYAFPPFHLIQAVINKVKLSQCRVVLIAPFRPNRSWFPELLSLLVSDPISLPVWPNLLVQLQKVLASKHRCSAASRLDFIKQSIRDKRFSKQVAEHVVKARRESSRKVYDAKWRVYLDWANKRQIDPIKATPNVIADFLTFLFSEKKCQVSTIRGYRSMISNTLKFSAGFDIGSHPVLSDLITSFQLQRPISRSLAPKWDLAFVLSQKCKAPFEPLSQCSLFHLSLKSAFLIAMATAKRVPEIHAFSIDKDHFRFSHIDGSLTLRTQPGFLAKNQLPSKAPDSIRIPKLSNHCRSSDFNRKLCPIRAIKAYIDRTKSIRNGRTRLFIPTKGGHDLKKSTISSWIKYTISHAYKSLSKHQIKLLKVKAHELRALSTSWAYTSSIPLEEVIKAAVWSNSSTFASFYLHNMGSQAENL